MRKKPAGGKAGGALERLQELHRFMVERNLELLEYDKDGLRARLLRSRPTAVLLPVPVPATHAAAPEAASAAAAVPPVQTPIPNGLAIKSPMMGIFYRASSPSSPPFVKAGDKVKRGHVLCLIEAMKVFNEVKADFDCVVVSVLQENGKPVKAGQDLLLVHKA